MFFNYIYSVSFNFKFPDNIYIIFYFQSDGPFIRTQNKIYLTIIAVKVISNDDRQNIFNMKFQCVRKHSKQTKYSSRNMRK